MLTMCFPSCLNPTNEKSRHLLPTVWLSVSDAIFVHTPDFGHCPAVSIVQLFIYLFIYLSTYYISSVCRCFPGTSVPPEYPSQKAPHLLCLLLAHPPPPT